MNYKQQSALLAGYTNLHIKRFDIINFEQPDCVVEKVLHRDRTTHSQRRCSGDLDISSSLDALIDIGLKIFGGRGITKTGTCGVFFFKEAISLFM